MEEFPSTVTLQQFLLIFVRQCYQPEAPELFSLNRCISQINAKCSSEGLLESASSRWLTRRLAIKRIVHVMPWR
ncbi:hypothetical protein WL02_27560 [Burkholderia ubonensis]|uniref:Uncharacterized protein n=1 Tax=Burkholderia ubonensis TaxID=101571 RepID=A0AAW3MIZ4_9BURK|nr:hypothetical protein WJ67_15075 [Burkholderia ubonensis]KVP83838.1 hypothetical protein WJ96_03255 [Burkholderia ubonensis]KVX08521.1 hypothetical protein WL02_27560 [Burkholderia ubonensis]KVZ94842.1 hypothetical protein WL25_13065 [Burkholderia ubonensis]KWD54345.1 hypothetical protein WL66_01360 [Burkholderia ubonensis]